MKELKTSSQQSTVQATSSNSYFSDFTSETKYNGLVDQSVIKVARNRLYQLMSYMDTAVPRFYAMHEVVTVWRYIQMLGPSLSAGYNNFWQDNSISNDAIGIISIFFHLVPPMNRFNAAVYAEFIYAALMIIFFIAIYVSASVYKNTAKLPNFIPPILSFFISTFMFLLHPVALNLCGEQISHLIKGDHAPNSLGAEIVAILLVILVFIVSFWFYKNISSISFTFRPVSFMAVVNHPPVILCSITYGYTFISAVASQLPTIPQIILTVIAGLLNFSMVYVLFMPGTFIRTYHQMLIFSASIAGGLHFLIVAVYIALGREASQPQFFVIIALIVVTLISGYFFLKKRENKQLAVLDNFTDNITNAEDVVASPKEMLILLCAGMKEAHPVCISWQLFNYSTERWPENVDIWSLFGKFVSIYPEETNLLAYIIRNIIGKKLTGSLAKETIMQATQIQMQRESSLSTDLKKKITHVQKDVSSTKRRLRSIWDLVIQGNISELEYSINNAYNSVDKTNNEFTHLISLYPNNRFVARGYARFLNEILGDFAQYIIWQDKIRVLQRGVAVNADITNQMGLHAFPLLPLTVSKTVGTTAVNNESETFSTLNEGELLDEETTQILSEQGSLTRSRIDELKIPAIRNIRFIVSFLFVILMIAPTVAILVYVQFYIDSMATPLEFMSYLSILRSYNFQLPLWVHHWINENLPFPSNSNRPMFAKPIFTHVPSTLGSSVETYDQLKFLLHECSANLEKLGTFRSYERDNKILELVHKVVFENSLNYDYYTSINTSYKTVGSVMSFFLDHVLQISSLSEEELSFNMFHSPKLLNSYLNANNLAENISAALICLTDFISEKSNNTTKIIRLVEIVVCIFFAILWIVLLCVQLIQLKGNKQEVYKCLTALPKNVVSSMSEAMRVLKKDENDNSRTNTEFDSEMNKQEENLLKIFASAGDSNSSVSADSVLFSVSYMFMMISAIVIFIVLCEAFPTISMTLTRNAPHLDDVMGTTAYMVGIFLALNNAVIANTNGYEGLVQINQGIGGRPIISSLGRVAGRLEQYLSYYHRARYGTSDSVEPPFDGYDEQTKIAAQLLKCENVSMIYTNVHDTYSCFPVDSQILLFEPFVNKFIQPILDNVNGAKIRTDDEIFVELWILSCNLYDTLFFPMFDGIVPQMKKMMAAALPVAQTPAIIFVAIGLILTVVILRQTFEAEKRMKFALRLLLHTQSKVVLQTQRISDVLSGDFSNRLKDAAQRNDVFFQSVVQNLPDAIVIASPQFQVHSCNSAFERIFHRPPLDEGGDVREFFSSKLFSQDVTPIFSDQQKRMKVQYQQDTTTAYLVINCGVANQNYVIITRDETQAISYNNLIREERAKSDRLLATILPPNLVHRVQEGETNISFSVSSATVTFMDIVEFTPWCASNTAASVMMTLNQLYKVFDARLATQPTMTKIKCIGDCYMAAGGIFASAEENSQTSAHQHAKEVVNFCLDCISAVRKIDEDMNQTLRIRAGVNTGGPLVAGVLGTEKPTFEILGPCINMAQQMEHNGMPMLVHISRSVYEFIYGGDFIIKERGQIEIKNGSVITYLVEGRKDGDVR